MIKELLLGFLFFYVWIAGSVGTVVFVLAIIEAIRDHNGR